MEKVNLTKVDPEIRDELNKFKADSNLNCKTKHDRLENMSEVLKRLLEDSKWLKNVIESNNDLRKELSEAKKKIKELQDEVDTLNAATTDLSFQQMKGE